MRRATRLTLTTPERALLTSWSEDPTLPGNLARRARIILLLADGLSISAIAASLGINRRFIYQWQRRFSAQGVHGLDDRRLPPYTPPRRARGKAPRQVATEADAVRMWTLRHLGYTWVQIAQTLGLTQEAITKARAPGTGSGDDAREDTHG